MWKFIFGKTFLEAVRAIDNKESARIWKSLLLLEHDPPPSGLNVEKLKTKMNLESCRVSKGYRVIFTRIKGKALIELLFVGNHDYAYKFANSYSEYGGKMPEMLYSMMPRHWPLRSHIMDSQPDSGYSGEEAMKIIDDYITKVNNS